MDYKIIATDLDGTLLNDHDEISAENRQAIELLREKGVEVVPASGRAYTEMPKDLRESPLFRYYITSDGTTIYDKETDTTHEIPLSRELGHWVLDQVYQYPMCMMLHAKTDSYVDAETNNEEDYTRFNLDRQWKDFTYEMDLAVPDFKKFAYESKIQSVVPFFEKMEDLEECRRHCLANPDLIVAQTDPYNLEIFSAKAGKGNALMLLADLLGVDPKATIAVGDSTNDYTMVKAAGLGLAMENAVPELKAVADEVICHYNEHNIQYIMKHFIK